MDVDPVLARFAADLPWVAAQDVQVARCKLGLTRSPADTPRVKAGSCCNRR